MKKEKDLRILNPEVKQLRKEKRVLIGLLKKSNKKTLDLGYKIKYVRKQYFTLFIEPFFQHLTTREKRILNLRFGFQDGVALSFKEIGLIFDVSSERIRQIEYKGVQKITAEWIKYEK